MKKSNYLPVLLLCLLTGLFLHSCSQDESTTESSIKSQDVRAQINEITSRYIQESIPSRANWPEVIGDDIYAFLTHDTSDYPYHHDTSLSERFSFAADYSAWKAGIINNGPNDIPSGTIDYSIALNENMYDFVGLFHVEIVNHIVTDTLGRYYNGNALNYEAILDYNNQFLQSKNLPVLQRNSIDLEKFLTRTATAFSAVNNSLIQAIQPVNEVETILQNYFIALENSTAIAQFTAYSKSIELLIIASEQFSQEEKKYLLTNMATARHDFGYWMSARN